MGLQEPVTIAEMVVAHCEKVFAGLGTPNAIRVWTEHGAMAFGGEPSDENYQAGPLLLPRKQFVFV